MDCYQALLEERMAVVEAEKQAEVCTRHRQPDGNVFLRSGKKMYRTADWMKKRVLHSKSRI